MWPFVSKPVRNLRMLVRQLKSERDGIARIKIVDSISAVGKAKGRSIFLFAVAALKEAAKNSDRLVRLRAIQALTRFAATDGTIYSMLAPMIQDHDPEVRNEVITAVVNSHNYPAMLESLHYGGIEMNPDLAIQIAACFRSDNQRLHNLDLWMKGQKTTQGVPPPADKTREDLMYERLMLQETVSVCSKHFTKELRKSRSIYFIRSVIVHLLNLWTNHPWDASIETLSAEFVEGDQEAVSAVQELLNGGAPETILSKFGHAPKVQAPSCGTCKKELEVLRFAIRESASSSRPTIVYGGIVCTECKRIQCSDCKGNPQLSPCKWCEGKVAPAYSKYL